MPYQANKPQAADQMSISQGDLQNNFLALKALVDVNHETFGSAYEGKHTIVSFPEQVVSLVPPVFPPATAATEMALYTQTLAGIFGLFLRRPNQAAGDAANDVNISNFLLTIAGAGTNTLNFPSGLQVRWGIGTADAANPTNYSAVFSNAATFVFVCSRDSGGGARQDFVQAALDTSSAVNLKTRFTTKSYTRAGNVSTSPISYIAIGY